MRYWVLSLPLFLFLASFSQASSEFVYSLRLGESIDSIRGKLDIGFRTKNADGYSFVGLQLVPGAPRYTTRTDLLFFQERLAGVIFTVDPRISDFQSYTERNKFLTNTYRVLAEKYQEKYKKNSGDEYVNCGLRAAHDYTDCQAKSDFRDKYKWLRLSYDQGKLYQLIIHRNYFESIDDFIEKALLSQYREHVTLANQALESSRKAAERGKVVEFEKSVDYELATLEVEYSDIP